MIRAFRVLHRVIKREEANYPSDNLVVIWRRRVHILVVNVKINFVIWRRRLTGETRKQILDDLYCQLIHEERRHEKRLAEMEKSDG
jgi:hypothetical protein